MRRGYPTNFPDGIPDWQKITVGFWVVELQTSVVGGGRERPSGREPPPAKLCIC
jgi:hypothetical protein